MLKVLAALLSAAIVASVGFALWAATAALYTFLRRPCS